MLALESICLSDANFIGGHDDKPNIASTTSRHDLHEAPRKRRLEIKYFLPPLQSGTLHLPKSQLPRAQGQDDRRRCFRSFTAVMTDADLRVNQSKPSKVLRPPQDHSHPADGFEYILYDPTELASSHSITVSPDPHDEWFSDAQLCQTFPGPMGRMRKLKCPPK